MGLFGLGKIRTGTVRSVVGDGRRFEWEIPNISTFASGTTLDSELASDYIGTRFHFHFSFSDNSELGFYLHYKQPPIPKYSYYLRNFKGEIMRQHTAHTIPEETERCGHWNVCTRMDLLEFIKGGPDTLTIVFTFDDDDLFVVEPTAPVPQVVLSSLPGMEGNPTGRIVSSDVAIPKVTQIIWHIPSIMSQCLWPFTSEGFSVGGAHVVARMDVRQKSNTTCVGKYDYADIDSVIFFLYAKKGETPSYAIELVEPVDLAAETVAKDVTPPLQSYASVAPKPAGMAQALLVPREEMEEHVKAGNNHLGLHKPLLELISSHGTRSSTCGCLVGKPPRDNLYVRFTIIQEENPLDMLNAQVKQNTASPTSSPAAGGKTSGKKKVVLQKPTKKYTQMANES